MNGIEVQSWPRLPADPNAWTHPPPAGQYRFLKDEEGMRMMDSQDSMSVLVLTHSHPELEATGHSS
jgi:acetylornithine/succinyldiaminopimelate/putrescine aminotransferase